MITAEGMRDAWKTIVEAMDPAVAFYSVPNVVRDVPSNATYPHVRWRVNTAGLTKDADGRFIVRHNVILGVYLLSDTDRAADDVITDHSEALDIAVKAVMDFDATYGAAYGLKIGEAHMVAGIEVGHENRTGVFVQIEVTDESGACGEEIPVVGSCSGVDILDSEGNVIEHVNDGDTYTITPMILPYANDAAASAITTVPTTSQVVHIVATGRFYPGNGTSTVAQLVSAKTFLPSVTMDNGLTTVVEGDTVNIQLYQ